YWSYGGSSCVFFRIGPVVSPSWGQFATGTSLPILCILPPVAHHLASAYKKSGPVIGPAYLRGGSRGRASGGTTGSPSAAPITAKRLSSPGPQVHQRPAERGGARGFLCPSHPPGPRCYGSSGTVNPCSPWSRNGPAGGVWWQRAQFRTSPRE